MADIEAAVEALPPPQQHELLRHLAEQVQKHSQAKRDLQRVAATGREITQLEIDDARDSQ